jgi:hypothetical protein
MEIKNLENLMSQDWEEKLKENPIHLVREKKEDTLEELKERYSGKVAVLDLYIKDIEKRGQWDGNVLRLGDIINIDHHAPIKEFSKNISSTNLAIEWVKKRGVLGKDYSVVVNHSDCDSVLSSLIIRGILPPDEKFGQAAIAADHTGEENEIADLLQALEDKRDLKFSTRNLQLLLEGKDPEPEAQKLLEKININRKKAREIVEKGEMINLGGISYVQLSTKAESSYFPALLPDAQVILVYCPLEKKQDHMEAKIRLGLAAPTGLTLDGLEINDIDPNFGCRWNAGSDRRAGGTSMDIEEYARLLNEKLQKYLNSKKE